MLTNISRRLKKMAGFTMVELMIVIAIIGIIAVAVLSAINPIEQINKGRDTRTRSDASEMLGALERYYAVEEKYPFTSVQNGSVTSDTAIQVASKLVGQGELKTSYNNRLGLQNGQSDLKLYMGGTDSDLEVCFTPASSQFHREATQKYWDSGRPAYLTASTYCMP